MWGASLLCVLGLAAPAQAQFTREITLTVNGGQVVGGAHPDFPMLVDVTNATADGLKTTGNGGRVQNANGYDIVFRGEDTTTCGGPATCMLAHEIELYDGVNGRVVAWVRIPSLTGTPTIHMYYGNAAITSPTASPGAVFDADYVGVWHLGETGVGNLYEYRDSSAYGNHGWGGQGDAVAVPKLVSAGKIGGAQRFDSLVDGFYDFIDVGQDGTLNITGDQITMQAWVWHNITINASHGTPPTQNNPYGILNHKGVDYGGYSLWLHGDTFSCPGANPIPEPCVISNISGETYSLRTVSPPNHIPPLAWHHVVATYDGATMEIVVDGVSRGTLARTGNVSPTIAEQHVWIGHGDQQQNRQWSGQFEGDIDEVRISRVGRSLNWIQTEYNNQSTPTGGFYNTGAPGVVSLSLNTPTVNYRSIGTAADYGTGEPVLGNGTTISVTVGSNAVTGAGTTWASTNRGQGDRITICDDPPGCTINVDYTILSVDSNTSLQLTAPYGPPGTTGAGKEYTISRMFASPGAWEQCIDNTAACAGVSSSSLPDDNRSEVGVLYADGSAYTSGGPFIVNFAGATTDPAHTVTLTVAPGNRHLGVPDGGANTGVVFDRGASAGRAVWVQIDHVTLEWLEITGGTDDGIEVGSAGDSISPANRLTIRNNLIHNVGGNGIFVEDPDTIVEIQNNFIFNTNHGLYLEDEMSSGARVNVYNNTIYNSTGQGIFSQVLPKQPRVTLRNNIVHTSNSGTWPDMYISRPFNEAYFCTTVGPGPTFNPGTCGANIAGALANETTNQVLPFTGVNTACLYLGSSQPFRGVGVSVVGAPSGSGANLQWDYWNGSWASLETGTFLDYNFEWDGFAYGADDPAGWSTRTVAAGAALYYVRVCRSGADSSPTERVISRADVSMASRFNLTQDRTSLLHSLWRGAGVTGLQEPGVATAVLFNSATDLHIRSGSMAQDAVLDFDRQDGGWQTSALTERFFSDVDSQVRPMAAAGSCDADPTNCWDVGADEFNGTTEVELLSFDAVPADSAVDLSWRTGSELRNLGFHLHRSLSKDGPWTRITPSLIPGLGSSPEGASYSFRDTGLTNGTRYFYRLEDIDAESRSTFHGPVSAVPGAAPPGEDGGSDPPGSDGSEDEDSEYKDAPEETRTYGRPEDASFRVVSRSKHAVVVELRTPGFTATPTPEGVRISVPGFDQRTDPRAPDLPVKRVVLDALVGRHARIVWVKERKTRSFPGLTPAAVGSAEIVSSPDGTVRPGRRAAVLKTDGLLPPFTARIAGDAFIGEDKKLALEMNPIRYDTTTGELLLARTLRVKIAFDRKAAREESGRGSRGRRRPRFVEDAAPQVLAHLHTQTRGLHAVSFETLFPQGHEALPLDSLRLSRQGLSVPFHVEPKRKTFGPGSLLFFHASTEARSTDYSPEVAYALERAPGGVPMPSVSASSRGSQALVSASLAEASFETNRYYQAGLLDAPDIWLWDFMVGGMSKSFPLTLEGADPTSVLSAHLQLLLQGASEADIEGEHHLSVSLNGTPLGETSFSGKLPHVFSTSVPASLLQEGENALTVTNLGDTGVYSFVFLDRVDLVYPQAPALHSGRFGGVFSEAGQVVVAGEASVGLDVTDPEAPVWMSALRPRSGTVSFKAEASHRYVLASPEGLLSPRVSPPVHSTLRSPENQAEYVVIAPEAFLETAQPLLERRRDQGLTAKAISFEEVASEFGHGRASAQAIRDFLAYAYHSWKEPSLRYVLLLGDSSYDPRNFTGFDQGAPLPAMWAKTSYLWTASDPILGAVNGEDLLPDVAIGRLPAKTLAEAHALVQKVLAFEDGAQDLSGTAVLVADNPDKAGDFEADVLDVLASFLSGRPTKTLFLRQLRGNTRPEILASFDEGASLMSYVGHGGAAVWASENVLNSWDTATLLAQSRQPLMLTFNCLNGYFVAPNYNSLSEAFLKAEGRGTIGSFSPSGLSLDAPAHRFHRALMAEITSGTHHRLGDAVLAAQAAYAETGVMPELLAIYHLLADPGMRIR